MSLLFLDTSALAKRYLTEIGSSWMRAQLKATSGNLIVISQLTTVEFSSLLARHQRTGNLPSQSAQRLNHNFLRHTHYQYAVMKIDDSTYKQAKSLVKRYPLRTLDAIQLACAIEATILFHQSIVFVSGDQQLLSAAAAESFTIENPYRHP